MIIIILLVSLFIIIFEVSFREVLLFSDISIVFILVNLFYWSKKYKSAILSGILSAVFIDLMLQNKLGETLLSIFIPILILSFFDNILRIESKLSKIVFSLLSTASSIFISDFLLKLVFLGSQFSILSVFKRIIISCVVLLVLSLIINSISLNNKKVSKYI